MSKKFLIITSIFGPTEAVQKFAAIKDWQLVVVGDKKTPATWQHPGVTYLGPEDQVKLGFSLTDTLPWNHYCRKMVGYLYAMREGADIIADTDDDNIPLDNWPSMPEGQNFKTLSGVKFANIYEQYTDKPVWPRGYPLPRLLSKEKPTVSKETASVGVWQFLANEDPDVDAIYRLTNNTPIYFDDGGHIALAKGTASPFNSQNTIFSQDFFPLLYLPAFVTFRFTDILRGLVAQPLLWQHDHLLGFGPATVIQKRNPHDYLRDFESEVPVYLHSERALDIVSESASSDKEQDLLAQLINAYAALRENQIVNDDELNLLEAWAKDIRSLTEH